MKALGYRAQLEQKFHGTFVEISIPGGRVEAPGPKVPSDFMAEKLQTPELSSGSRWGRIRNSRRLQVWWTTRILAWHQRPVIGHHRSPITFLTARCLYQSVKQSAMTTKFEYLVRFVDEHGQTVYGNLSKAPANDCLVGSQAQLVNGHPAHGFKVTDEKRTITKVRSLPHLSLSVRR
jgi:hypothetical protein